MKKGLFLVIVLVIATIAQAQVSNPYVAIATKDNSIYNSARVNSTSNGKGSFIIAGTVRTSYFSRRGLIYFDLSKCFTGITPLSIDSVTLTLSTDSAGHHRLAANRQFFLYAAPESWGEGCSDGDGHTGVGAPAEAGDATWNSRYISSQPDSATTPTPFLWTTPGAVPPRVLPLATAISPDTVIQFAQMTWRSASLTATVAGWITNPCTNNGFVLEGPENEESDTLTAISFYSKDACAPDSLKPTLTIYYNAGKATVSTSASSAIDHLAAAIIRKEDALAVVTKKEDED
jgi:hypothetical protein